MAVIELTRGDALTVAHPLSGYAKKVVEPFDLKIENIKQHSPFILPPELPDAWGIGIIVGASGTGKSTLLSQFESTEEKLWRYSDTVLDVFEKMGVSESEAADRLSAAGLNSVPSWVRPVKMLSTGERFRAELAMSLRDGAVVDEYTSVVSRPVAVSASISVRKWVNRTGAQRLVFASCHYDIVKPIQPDWVINSDIGIFTDEPDWTPSQWWKDVTLDKEAGSLGWK